MKYTIMLVPGHTVKVTSETPITVLEACSLAQNIRQDIDWVKLAQSKQVRVNGMIFSSVEKYADSSYAGDIATTKLDRDGQILIMTKIQGNREFDVITCEINGEMIALEGPTSIMQAFQEHCGVRSISEIESADVNGDSIDRNYVIKDGDKISYQLKATASIAPPKPMRAPKPVGFNPDAFSEEQEEDEPEGEVMIDGESYDDQESAIRAILDSGSFDTNLDQSVIDAINAVLDI